MERVRDAGGHLQLVGLDEEELAAWRRASKIVQLRMLRAGHERLRRRSGPGRLTLYLTRTDIPPPRARPPAARQAVAVAVPRTAEFLGRRVRVPARVTAPDPLLAELEASLDWPERSMRLRWGGWDPVSPRCPVQRMRRIWQGIVNEARHRGYSVRVTHDRRDHTDRGQLVLTIGRDEFPLSLYGDRRTTLQLSTPASRPTRRRRLDTWTDGQDGRRLETVLGEVFTHLERRAEILIEERAQQQRRQDEIRAAEDRRVAAAVLRFAEQERRTTVTHRLAAAQLADDARAYAAALLDAATGLEPVRAAAVAEWAQWASHYADRTDPRRTLTEMPAPRTPTREELRPYLHGQHLHGQHPDGQPGWP